MRSSHEQYEVEIWHELEPIRARWNLLERTGVSTPFQSYVWISALLDTVGGSLGAEPHVAIVKDRNSGEDLMLLPLVRSRRRLLHFMEMPDFGTSDYNSPIVSRVIASDARRVAESWDAAMQALPAGDVFRISKVPEIVSHVRNPLLGLGRVRSEVYSSWQIALPENLREIEQNLSSSTRRQIRRRTRQLEAAGPLQYVAPASGAEAKTLFAILRRQRQPRFAALGRYDILASAPHRAFYNRVVERGLDNGISAVHALQVGDETVATAFGLYWQKRFHLLMTSMAGGPMARKFSRHGDDLEAHRTHARERLPNVRFHDWRRAVQAPLRSDEVHAIEIFSRDLSERPALHSRALAATGACHCKTQACKEALNGAPRVSCSRQGDRLKTENSIRSE